VIRHVCWIHEGEDETDAFQEHFEGLSADTDTCPEGGFRTLSGDSMLLGVAALARVAIDKVVIVLTFHRLSERLGDTVDKILGVGENSTSHRGDLLDNMNAGASSRPVFLAPVNGVEGGKERRDAKNGSDNGGCMSCGVPDILVGVVDPESHGGDHMGKTGSF
jgi:hypothetical protein